MVQKQRIKMILQKAGSNLKCRRHMMRKQILIVKGSPRKNGNTSAMADAFAKGASENGNTF